MIEGDEKKGNTPKKIGLKLNFKPTQEYSVDENNLLQSMAHYLEKRVWKWDIQDAEFAFSLPKTIFLESFQLGLHQHSNQEVNYFNAEDMNRRPLTRGNLESIWNKGSFTILSQIEDLPYVWQLSQWIVKGYSNIKRSLWDDLSQSFCFVYSIRNRVTRANYESYSFSFPSSFYSLYRFFWETANLFIGLPCFENNDSAIRNKVVKRNLVNFLDANSSSGVKLYVNTMTEKLFIFDSQFEAVWKKEAPIKETEYSKRRLSTPEKMMKLFEDKSKAFTDFLSGSKDFNDLNDVYQCLSFVLANRVIIDIKLKKKEEIEQATADHENLLKQSYIRYRINQWKNDQVSMFTTKLKEEVKEKYQNEIQNCLWKYEMPSLFYKNYRDNKRDFQTKFEEEKKETPQVPQNRITIARRCMRPYEKYYEINFNGENILRLRNYKYYEVGSSFAFWRIWVFMLKFFIFTFNIGLALLKWGLNSSLGLNALFCTQLFQDEELLLNGEVVEIIESWTYPKSLSNLMIWISYSRNSFEMLPDTGLFGKSFGRVFNVLYNYVIKLVFIGLLLLIGYPILIISNAVISLVLFIASPLLSLIAVACEYLWNLLCHDTKYRGAFILPLLSYIAWHLLAKGLIQLAMVLVCLIFQPILSFFMVLFGISRFCLRTIYDAFMFSLVKCIGKVPVTDSGFAWKTSGPGITYDHFAQISNEELIKYVHATLEEMQLSHYAKTVTEALDKPLTNVSRLNKLLSSVQMTYNISNSITESITHYKNILDKELRQRRELYPTLGLYRVKYSKSELELVKGLAQKYLFESFSNEDYSFVWEQFTLLEGSSWDVLTEKILQKTFGHQILKSLEDNDLVVHIGGKTNSALDLIAKKVFEDPLFSNKQLIKDVKQQIVARVPAFSSLRFTFSNRAFILPLDLLSQQEKEHYFMN